MKEILLTALIVWCCVRWFGELDGPPLFDSLSARASLWTIFYRLASLVQTVALGGLLPQLIPLVGERGLSPLKLKLARVRNDFSSLAQRWAAWPSAWWIVGTSDRAIVAIGALGVAGALSGALGSGELARGGSIIAWATLLSINTAEGLSYPWDCLLFEVSFLKLFLPPPAHRLGGSSGAALPAAIPSQLVRFTLRLLLFRVLVGFGKLKFLPTHASEAAYIKHFVVALPIPTVLGIGASQWLPTIAFKLSLVVMFLVELPLPCLIFAGGGACHVAAALGIFALQLGIAATGNFGYFNLLTAVLCVPLLDWRGVEGSGGSSSAPTTALQVTALTLPLLSAALHFWLNSWCTQSWLFWPVFGRVSHELEKACTCRGGERCGCGCSTLLWYALDVVTGVLRALAPFRIAHAYGIFMPHAPPPVRYVVTLEGSALASGASDECWEEYFWKWQPSHERQRPAIVAPHHPRLDHDVFYWAQGFDNHNLLSTLGHKGPYAFCATSRLTRMRRLMQRLLEGGSPVQHLLGHNPFPDGPDGRGPPLRIRARLWMMRPLPVAEAMRTGRWWRRDAMGAFWDSAVPATSCPEVWLRWPPAPLRWHVDSLLWRRRCAPLAAFMRAKRVEVLANLMSTDSNASGEPRYLRHFRKLHASAAALLPPASSALLENEIVLETWAGLEPIAIRTTRRCETAEGRCHVEALRETLATLTLLLIDAFEPFYFLRWSPRIVLPRVSTALFGTPLEEDAGDGAEQRSSESYHLSTLLLAQHIVLHGFASVHRALLEPVWAISTFAPHVTMHSGLLLQAALYPRELAAAAAAARLQRAVPIARGEMQQASGGGILPGILDCTTWLAEEQTLRRLCTLGVGPSVRIPSFTRRGDEWIVKLVR